MNRQEKQVEVEKLRDSFMRAKAVLFADYRGVGANDMNELRAKFREQDAEVKVIKNNLVRVALKDNERSPYVENLAGTTVAFFAYKDAAAVAKSLTEFNKKVEALTLKDGLLGAGKVSEKDVKALAELPSREVLLAQLLGVMNGPIRGFVTVLSAVPRDFVTVLQAIADKKGKGGEA